MMLIQNYGLYWERKYIHTGAGSNKGHFLGRRENNNEIDFREQIGIYVLYDRTFVPVYVGQAGNGNANLFTRLKNHTKDHLSNRWELFSWFGIRKVNGNSTLFVKDNVDKNFKCDGVSLLNQLEGILISAMEPSLNKQGSKFGLCCEYKQVVDDNVRELSLVDLLDEIKELKKQNHEIVKRIGR
jgi:hypothetical protein